MSCSPKAASESMAAGSTTQQMANISAADGLDWWYCWGSKITDDVSKCTPAFEVGTGHFKNKFCPECRANGVDVKFDCIRRALPASGLDKVKNEPRGGFWNASKGFCFRLINQTAECTGDPIVVSKHPMPITDGLAPLDAAVCVDGYVKLRVGKGTLIVADIKQTKQVAAKEKHVPPSVAALGKRERDATLMPPVAPPACRGVVRAGLDPSLPTPFPVFALDQTACSSAASSASSTASCDRSSGSSPLHPSMESAPLGASSSGNELPPLPPDCYPVSCSPATMPPCAYTSAACANILVEHEKVVRLLSPPNAYTLSDEQRVSLETHARAFGALFTQLHAGGVCPFMKPGADPVVITGAADPSGLTCPYSISPAAPTPPAPTCVACSGPTSSFSSAVPVEAPCPVTAPAAVAPPLSSSELSCQFPVNTVMQQMQPIQPVGEGGAMPVPIPMQPVLPTPAAGAMPMQAIRPPTERVAIDEHVVGDMEVGEALSILMAEPASVESGSHEGSLRPRWRPMGETEKVEQSERTLDMLGRFCEAFTAPTVATATAPAAETIAPPASAPYPSPPSSPSGPAEPLTRQPLGNGNDWPEWLASPRSQRLAGAFGALLFAVGSVFLIVQAYAEELNLSPAESESHFRLGCLLWTIGCFPYLALALSLRYVPYWRDKMRSIGRVPLTSSMQLFGLVCYILGSAPGAFAVDVWAAMPIINFFWSVGSVFLIVDPVLELSSRWSKVCGRTSAAEVSGGVFFCLASGFGGYHPDVSGVRFGMVCWLLGSLCYLAMADFAYRQIPQAWPQDRNIKSFTATKMDSVQPQSSGWCIA